MRNVSWPGCLLPDSAFITSAISTHFYVLVWSHSYNYFLKKKKHNCKPFFSRTEISVNPVILQIKLRVLMFSGDFLKGTEHALAVVISLCQIICYVFSSSDLLNLELVPSPKPQQCPSFFGLFTDRIIPRIIMSKILKK